MCHDEEAKQIAKRKCSTPVRKAIARIATARTPERLPICFVPIL